MCRFNFHYLPDEGLRYFLSDTIEEKILQLQEKKSALADLFAQSANPFSNMTEEDIIELFE